MAVVDLPGDEEAKKKKLTEKFETLKENKRRMEGTEFAMSEAEYKQAAENIMSGSD